MHITSQEYYTVKLFNPTFLNKKTGAFVKIKINKKEKFNVYINNRKTFGITQEGMKTTLLCSLISATLAIQPALGAKKEVTLSEGNPAEISENIFGADGSQDRPGNDDGEAGEDALIVNVVPGSLQNENILTINSGTSISGGEGGWAGDDDVTKMGSAGGRGGTAITGNNFTLVNSGYISGGKGGWGGYGNGGGDGGEAGIAISGDDLTITNNGSITGGNGGMPGASGYGDESGGLTGTPAVGGTAISGNNLQISNNGNITAGQGSSGASGRYGVFCRHRREWRHGHIRK